MSSFTIICFIGLLVYLVYEIFTLKKEVNKLKEEVTRLQSEILFKK